MQNTFKVGDKVRQKDEAVVKASDGSYLYKSQELVGKVLTVIEVEGKEYLHFDRINEDIPHQVYCWERFELVEETKEQHNYKVGGYVKVKKITHQYANGLYDKVIGKKFKIKAVEDVAVSTVEDYYFYFDEIEPTTPDVITSPVTPAPKKQKNHAWAVVDKSSGKVQWIRQTRSAARKLAQFQNETSTHLYQVKKIEFNFV